MNRLWKITGVVAVLGAVVVLAGATVAFAQGTHQPDDVTQSKGNPF
jgi:hypothetical protein